MTISETLKELEELAFTIEDGKLEGCKVYHEAIPNLVKSLVLELIESLNVTHDLGCEIQHTGKCSCPVQAVGKWKEDVKR